MKDLTDEQLAKSYLKGDEKSLEELVRRYLSPIYNFSRRYTGDSDNASDIAQEVFVKVWKNLKMFDPKKGNFKFWLFTVAKNTALDWLKKKDALPLSLIEDTADSKQISMVDVIYKKSLLNNLQLAITKLPPKYSLVMNLYHTKGLNFREIADFLKEPINTVKSRYRRGLITLRKLL